jgi:general secretion pathway protein D
MKCRVLVLAALAVAGCATSAAFRAGEKAEHREEFDKAVLEYSKAAKEQPGNLTYRKVLERAKLRAAEEHSLAARRFEARGLLKESLDELRLANDLSPSVDRGKEIERVEALRRSGTLASTVEDVKSQARERAFPGLALGPEAAQPLGLTFRGSSLRDAYEALGRAVGVNFVFDPDFQDTTINLDLRNVPFEQALLALGSAGKTFHRVGDSHMMLVIPDTADKRREFERQVVKTFFLSNADLKEAVDLLRIVLGARRVAPLPGSNALTINDTPEKVAAAERIVDIIDKRRAEVVVEVEILEVNRQKLKEYGIEITSGIESLPGIAGLAFPKSNPLDPNTLDENPYRKSNIVISQLPGVIYRLLKTDAATRLLANPQIRTTEGQTAQARFGDQVPVPVTTFTPLATGGIQQQPVTSFDYKNVGVNIDITPRVHHDGEVSLGLKLDISAVGPAGFQGLPTFNSRTVTSQIRLRDGETNILAGLISDTERKSMRGLPGLANLPVLGKLFANNKEEEIQTDIVMTLTPHIVSQPKLTLEDLRAFTLGSETSPLLFDVPAVPAAPTTPVTPAPRPSTDTPRAEPIRPPLPTPTPTPNP